VRLSEIESFAVLPEDSKHGSRIEIITRRGDKFNFYFNNSDKTLYGNTKRGLEMVGELLRIHIANNHELNFTPDINYKNETKATKTN
jgi:hypothetical protein